MIDLHRLPCPPAGTDQSIWIGEIAAKLCLESPEVVETFLADRVAAELAHWRLDHAVLWQRVRLRIRLILKQRLCVRTPA